MLNSVFQRQGWFLPTWRGIFGCIFPKRLGLFRNLCPPPKKNPGSLDWWWFMDLHSWNNSPDIRANKNCFALSFYISFFVRSSPGGCASAVHVCTTMYVLSVWFSVRLCVFSLSISHSASVCPLCFYVCFLCVCVCVLDLCMLWKTARLTLFFWCPHLTFLCPIMHIYSFEEEGARANT